MANRRHVPQVISSMSTCGAIVIASLTSSRPAGDRRRSLRRFGLGLSICFDVRFRVVSKSGARRRRRDRDTGRLQRHHGRAHWDLLFGRAIENHAFVVAAAQSARPPRDRDLRTLILSTRGRSLAEQQVTPGGRDGHLDVSEVARRRAQIAVMTFVDPTSMTERPRHRFVTFHAHLVRNSW